MFCWKNLLKETGTLQFEKITGNGLACEAHLKLSADKRSTEPFGKAPGLPYISLADEKFGLPRTEKTLAERLKSAGYITGMVCKWHLGHKPDLQPTARGFDEFFGFLSGASNYLPGPRRGDSRNPILRGTQTVEEKEYLTDAFGREAVAFIEKHHARPFFVYLPFNAVHGPLEASDKYLKRFDTIKDPKRRTFAAMLSAMDDNIGRVLSRNAK